MYEINLFNVYVHFFIILLPLYLHTLRSIQYIIIIVYLFADFIYLKV